MSLPVGITVALLVLGAIAFLWRLGAQPQRHKRVSAADLDRFLTTLLERGSPGAVLYIETAAKRSAFIQFAKYQDGSNVGLQFAFPRAPWSEEVFASVEDAMDSAGFAILKRPGDGGGDVREFLLVDLGANVVEATRLAVTVVPVVFGARKDAPILELHFKGVRAA